MPRRGLRGPGPRDLLAGLPPRRLHLRWKRLRRTSRLRDRRSCLRPLRWTSRSRRRLLTVPPGLRVGTRTSSPRNPRWQTRAPSRPRSGAQPGRPWRSRRCPLDRAGPWTLEGLSPTGVNGRRRPRALPGPCRTIGPRGPGLRSARKPRGGRVVAGSYPAGRLQCFGRPWPCSRSAGSVPTAFRFSPARFGIGP